MWSVAASERLVSCYPCPRICLAFLFEFQTEQIYTIMADYFTVWFSLRKVTSLHVYMCTLHVPLFKCRIVKGESTICRFNVERIISISSKLRKWCKYWHNNHVVWSTHNVFDQTVSIWSSVKYIVFLTYKEIADMINRRFYQLSKKKLNEQKLEINQLI